MIAPLTMPDAATYAQTCVPFSGIMVNLASFSFRRSHATFPSEDSDAVNSVAMSLYANALTEHEAYS